VAFLKVARIFWGTRPDEEEARAQIIDLLFDASQLRRLLPAEDSTEMA